ncbi:MAG: imidazoleglycerol-phosphate dehydratase HisB [Lachnospiraceae bacterium]|nr:imidazoleglycerol-phosphate dehydratase HisB [Lachnospiraceae bacterium]
MDKSAAFIPERKATVSRTTGETAITVTINLDGAGTAKIHTGIGFFDHMLESFSRHGFFDLEVEAKGDLHVDCHHTIEDTGIVLGTAIRQALGEKKAVRRYGSIMLPMDETLVLCALDLSGRPYFVYDVPFQGERIGEFDTQMVKEFFYAISYSCGMNLHMKKLYGENDHHIAEAVFKAFAKALDEAAGLDGRISNVLSTKGSL